MALPEKLTPQNLEAEQSFLGSLLLDHEAMLKVADSVQADDFYLDKHRRIYEAMIDLYRKSEPIDLLSLGSRLQELGDLERVGGRAELISLSNAVPSSSHIVHYGEIIQKKATLRRLLQAAGQITALGYETNEDVATLLDQAEQSLFSVSQKVTRKSFTAIKDVLADTFDRIDELHREKGKLRGVPSGFKDLDDMLGGMQKSDLIILAARPSCGKSSLALDIARNAAIRSKVSVGIFSLEMSKDQLAERMLCAEARVDLWRMRNGHLSDSAQSDDFPKIGHAIGTLSEAQIHIDDTASANIMEVRTKCRRLQMEHGLGMIIIDYLQLMESRGKGSDNRTQEVAEITRGLKAIARELNVPVIALSQLSRTVELQKPAIPRLAHLRESGSIEQDADVVLFIYRKAADRNYRLEDISPEEQNIAEIHIAKHRNGPTGMVKLYFDAANASFRSLSKDTGMQGFVPPPNNAPAMNAAPAMANTNPF